MNQNNNSGQQSNKQGKGPSTPQAKSNMSIEDEKNNEFSMEDQRSSEKQANISDNDDDELSGNQNLNSQRGSL